MHARHVVVRAPFVTISNDDEKESAIYNHFPSGSSAYTTLYVYI